MHQTPMNFEYFSYRVIIMLYCNIMTCKYCFLQKENIDLSIVEEVMGLFTEKGIYLK